MYFNVTRTFVASRYLIEVAVFERALLCAESAARSAAAGPAASCMQQGRSVPTVLYSYRTRSLWGMMRVVGCFDPALMMGTASGRDSRCASISGLCFISKHATSRATGGWIRKLLLLGSPKRKRSRTLISSFSGAVLLLGT